MPTPLALNEIDPVAEGGSPSSAKVALPPAVIVAEEELLTEMVKFVVWAVGGGGGGDGGESTVNVAEFVDSEPEKYPSVSSNVAVTE